MLHAAASPDWDCPWRHNENVGAYFQDHLVGRVASIDVLDRKRFFNTFCTIIQSGHKFQPKLRMTNETLQRFRIMNIQGMMSFESSISENLVYLKQFLKAVLYSRKFSGIGDLARNLRACGKHLLPLMWKYMIDNRIFVPSTSKISLNIQGEQTPLRDSRVSIDSTIKDAAGLPKVILDWKVGSEELASIRDFTHRCDQALRESGLASLQMVEDLQKLEPKFLTTLRDNYHHAGGARMAETAEDGVVDRDLRVFDTTNLYVAGAATFRTTSNANTTFTALALVTRLIEHLTSARDRRLRDS
jgi:choline dehydrogenase-like flavoprotein